MNNHEVLPGKLIVGGRIGRFGKIHTDTLVHQWLKGLGCKVFFTEWNSSELVKELKVGKKKHILTPTTFSLIQRHRFLPIDTRGKILPMLKG